MDLTAFAGALTTANLSTTLSNSKTGITVRFPPLLFSAFPLAFLFALPDLS